MVSYSISRCHLGSIHEQVAEIISRVRDKLGRATNTKHTETNCDTGCKGYVRFVFCVQPRHGHQSSGSPSPGSLFPANSQISNSSTQQKKGTAKSTVTDPNHGKEFSQKTTKVKSQTTVVSMAFLTQERASSITQNVNIEGSIAGDSTSGSQTSPSTIHSRQEQDGTQSDRAKTSLPGYVAGVPQGIQDPEDSTSVSGQTANIHARSRFQPPLSGQQESILPPRGLSVPPDPYFSKPSSRPPYLLQMRWLRPIVDRRG